MLHTVNIVDSDLDLKKQTVVPMRSKYSIQFSYAGRSEAVIIVDQDIQCAGVESE